uniref:Ras-GAP domain-containing protein n=1 Tax=Panagrellus redivivus TaxID=6233 RepID=A0A7E4W7B4_PANRE
MYSCLSSVVFVERSTQCKKMHFDPLQGRESAYKTYTDQSLTAAFVRFAFLVPDVIHTCSQTSASSGINCSSVLGIFLRMVGNYNADVLEKALTLTAKLNNGELCNFDECEAVKEHLILLWHTLVNGLEEVALFHTGPVTPTMITAITSSSPTTSLASTFAAAYSALDKALLKVRKKLTKTPEVLISPFASISLKSPENRDNQQG